MAGTALAADFPHWDIATYCEESIAGNYTTNIARMKRADCIARQTEAREKLKYMQDPQEIARECAEKIAATDEGNYVRLQQCIARGNK